MNDFNPGLINCYYYLNMSVLLMANDLIFAWSVLGSLLEIRLNQSTNDRKDEAVKNISSIGYVW